MRSWESWLLEREEEPGDNNSSLSARKVLACSNRRVVYNLQPVEAKKLIYVLQVFGPTCLQSTLCKRTFLAVTAA
jgi:hypothetical protein